MPYDKALDKELFKESKEFAGTRVSVGVYSYNGGEKKLQLSREDVDQAGEWRFSKLGRMTKDEAKQIVPILSKAVELM